MLRWMWIPLVVLPPAAIAIAAAFWPPILWAFVAVGPLVLLGLYDCLQTRHTILRIYPIIGHFRYGLEDIGPELHQYFVESDTDGSPYSRERRSIVYERAKDVSDVEPFGTVFNLEGDGAQYILHSIVPAPMPDDEPRIEIGGPGCSHPYSASRFNISAMSFGSISPPAIRALNRAAKKGGFFHDTGEGGLSPYHLEAGGDLVWEIGTGYFSCRTKDGDFDEHKFADGAAHDQVRMIELKLSQGAKPGHGGVLPAAKVTKEIAEARGVPQGEDCISPPRHKTFNTPIEMMHFIARLRELAGGKPTGFKLCVGHPREWFAVCKAMRETEIYPDFITVDGAEGGTGAAPFELSDSVGMPLDEGLSLVHNTLVGLDLRRHIRILASGKVVTGFDIATKIALGADACNAARAMMFALGCIQAQRCHNNTCPTGITTLDPWRMRGLDVDDKTRRVANFHRNTVKSFLHVLAAAGLHHPDELTAAHIYRRINPREVRTLDELYPQLQTGDLLNAPAPAHFRPDAWSAADPARF